MLRAQRTGRRRALLLPRLHTFLAAALAASLLSAAPLLSAAHAGVAATTSRGAVSVVTWGASADRLGRAVHDRTYRLIVHTSTGGAAPRLRLSNVFGKHPVTLGPVYVGLRRAGAALLRGSNRRVAFHGAATVTIAPGHYVVSDPVLTAVPERADLAVSLYVRAADGPATGHLLAFQTSYVSAGDHAADPSAAAYGLKITSWYYLDAVAVTVDPRRVGGAVAALGDSITDGAASTPDTNHRWPDFLARRLLADPAAPLKGVANEGISGNRLLADGNGPSGLHRFGRDVLAQPGVRTLIVLEGVNDIKYGTSGATFGQLVAGYRALLAAAHAAHRCVVGATIMPFGGYSAWTPAREAVREAVNAYIRGSGEFDAVVDFDRVARDPAHPARLLPGYDSGDHLHPDDAGMRALGAAVAVNALRCAR